MANDLASQLTLASLSGGLGANGQQMDPVLAAALPRLQLAQQMMQSGMSDAPTSKWGALSRVGQSMLGNYTFNQATQGLHDAYAGAASNMAASLPKGPNGEDHPLVAALKSPDAMTRAAAMKVYPAALTQLSTVDQARAGSSPTIGVTNFGGPRGGYSGTGQLGADATAMPGVVAAGIRAQGGTAGAEAGARLPSQEALAGYNASLAGPIASAEAAARVPSIQSNAANEAAQRLWEENNRNLPNTPAGVSPGPLAGAPQPRPPGLIAPGRNPIPPGAPDFLKSFDPITGEPLATANPPPMPTAVPKPIPGGGLPSPVQAIPPPAPAQPPGPPGAPPSNAAAPPVSPPAPETAATPEPIRAPGQTAAVSALPPPDVHGKMYDQYQKMESAASSARDEIQEATLLKQTLHGLGSTGPATPFLANLSRYGAQIGMTPEQLAKFNLPPGATETEAAALSNGLVMEIAKQRFGNRITNSDLQFAQTTKPSPSMPLPAADFLIDNTLVPRAQRDIDRFGQIVNMTNPKHPDYDPGLGSMSSKLYDFDKAHPLNSYTPALNSPGGAPPPAFKEGQTATHSNGAKVIFQGGQWVPVPGGPK